MSAGICFRFLYRVLSEKCPIEIYQSVDFILSKIVITTQRPKLWMFPLFLEYFELLRTKCSFGQSRSWWSLTEDIMAKKHFFTKQLVEYLHSFLYYILIYKTSLTLHYYNITYYIKYLIHCNKHVFEKVWGKTNWPAISEYQEVYWL